MKVINSLFKDKNSDHAYFLPLGGSGEIGMNLNLYGYKDNWLIVDCGVSFKDSKVIGADVFMPNIDAIIENITQIDLRDTLSPDDINRRKELIEQRKHIEDMLDSIDRDMSRTKRKTVTQPKQRPVDSTGKYSPMYPTFNKGQSTDIKNPYMFLKSMKIALEASNIDPKKLKENVTSPGGTTEAGLLVLQSNYL